MYFPISEKSQPISEHRIEKVYRSLYSKHLDFCVKIKNKDNIKGRSNGKVIYKLKKTNNKDPFGSHGCYIMCKRDEWNQKFVPKNTENFNEYLWTKGKEEVFVKTKNGVVHPASDYA